jgi:hypothetical protein
MTDWLRLFCSACLVIAGCSRTAVLPGDASDDTIGGSPSAVLGGVGGMGGASAVGGAVPTNACAVPSAPVIDDAEVLHFTVDGDLAIETAIQPATRAAAAAVYVASSDVALADHYGQTRVLARVRDASCVPVAVFDAVYDVRPTCAPAEQSAGSTAVAMSDPLLVGWADAVRDFSIGLGSTNPMFTDPKKALGPAEGTSFGVVSLGDAGSITLSFSSPISNADSWDLAVFENAFNDSYLELGFVEVSSDGQSFARFDSAFLGTGPTSRGYAGHAQSICGLAGSYRAGFGTPFDLEALQNQPLARSGALDLKSIRYVRVVDIVGDGNTADSFGRPIFDPSPSNPNAGFDLDAIAALHDRASDPE